MLERVDALREAAVLRLRAGVHAMHRQQAVLPLAVEEQPLLRAVAQRALVVFPAAGHAPAQAQFLEQVLHLARIVAGHRQVVRAERAGDAVDHAAARIAARAVLELEQREVVDAREAQRARRREPGDATAGDQHAGLAGARGLARLQRAVAHRVAARHVDPGEAAFDGWRRIAAGERERTGGADRAEETAPPHGRIARALNVP